MSAAHRSTASDIGTRPYLVVSDVHLGAVPASTERSFLEFLTFASREARGLVIAGDLFDLWYAPRSFVPRRYVRPLAALAGVVDAGVEVFFVSGNRDAAEWGDALGADVGLTVLPDPSRVQLAGRRTLVAHGDGVAPGHAEYAKPYGLLRQRWVVSAAQRLLPSSWLFETLARRSGTLTWVERHARGESTGPKARAPQIENWARLQLATDRGLRLVICGHSHLPALVEVEPGRHYVNAGDWVSHFTYAVVPSDDRSPEVRRWPSRELVDWNTLDDGRNTGS